MMLLCICLTLYLIHNITVFWYFSHIFLRTDNRTRRLILCIAANTALLLLFFQNPVSEWVLMAAYLCLLILELKLVFKDRWIKIVFGSACFSLNFFAIRLIYIVLYAQLAGITITQAVQVRTAMLHIMIFTLLTNIPYTVAFHLFFPKTYMDSILSDRENLKFVSMIVGAVYVYLTLNTKNLYCVEPFGLMPLFQLKIAVCALFGFAAAFFYAYLFARLRLYAIKTKEIETELQIDEEAVRQLEDEAYHDGFTGCFNRAFAEGELDRLLAEKPPFSLVFIDMDGLKAANDQYGHNEGDFYIRKTAEILREEFVGKTVARMGGDEFLVILEQVDSYAATRSAVRCYDSVKGIRERYHKPYPTSISYGMLEVMPDNTLTRQELVELVDSRMYSFKRSKQRARAVRKA